MPRCNFAKVLLLVGAFALALPAGVSEAQRSRGGGDGAQARGARSAPTSVNGNRGGNANRNSDVNRNRDVNRSRDVNRNTNVNVNGGYDNDCCDGDYNGGSYHPVAAAMVVGATAAVVGNAIAPPPAPPPPPY